MTPPAEAFLMVVQQCYRPHHGIFWLVLQQYHWSCHVLNEIKPTFDSEIFCTRWSEARVVVLSGVPPSTNPGMMYYHLLLTPRVICFCPPQTGMVHGNGRVLATSIHNRDDETLKHCYPTIRVVLWSATKY